MMLILRVETFKCTAMIFVFHIYIREFLDLVEYNKKGKNVTGIYIQQRSNINLYIVLLVFSILCYFMKYFVTVNCTIIEKYPKNTDLIQVWSWLKQIKLQVFFPHDEVTEAYFDRYNISVKFPIIVRVWLISCSNN